MPEYKGQEYSIEVGKDKNGNRFYLNFPKSKRAPHHIEAVGFSGTGKSALVKHIAVQTSKIRKICVFDYKGEWADHIVEKSNHPYCEFPEKLTNYKILDNISCTISEFVADEPSVLSLGFSVDGARDIAKLATQGFHYHKDNIELFSEMLNNFPTKKDNVEDYNAEYGVNLPGPQFESTVKSFVNHFDRIKEWFYDSENPSEERKHWDFKKEFLNNDHLILKFNYDPSNKYKAIVGIVLKQLREIQHQTKAAYFIDEAGEVLPNLNPNESVILPSSIIQVQQMLVQGRKETCQVVIILQSEDQVYRKMFKHFYFLLAGKDSFLKYHEREAQAFEKMKIKYNPFSNIIEFGYADHTGFKTKFIPSIACCRV